MRIYTKISNNLRLWIKKIIRVVPKWSRIIIAIAATLSAVIFLFTISLNFYSDTIGSMAVAYKKLNNLSTDAQIDYFKSNLGSPIFVNRNMNFIEYIFVDKYFYVQALCEKDKVLMYSVTTRDKNFNPKFQRTEYSYDASSQDVKAIPQIIELGKTTFHDASKMLGDPEGLSNVVGVRRFFYKESYYFGNPGNYQTFIFSVNDASSVITAYPPDNQKSFGSFNIDSKNVGKTIQEILTDVHYSHFRKEAVINTFTVISPTLYENYESLPIGPDLDQVRLLTTINH